jgi:2-hydroxy-3-keto-5-methylthiopentenyl-1-phosphate phosphatase
MTRGASFEAYFDFDNTITEYDLLDEIIARYSVDEAWKQAEEDWAAGRIGSRECLERQVSRIRVNEADLRSHLAGVRVDPSFAPIVAFLGERGIEPVILSDSFTPFIRTVLDANGLGGLTILANGFSLDGDTPVLSFPYHGSICSTCANCKTSHLMRRDRPRGTRKIYVGDGRSDICPAGFCEILFAKEGLFEHHRDRHPHCVRFERLDTVLDELRRLIP